MIKHNDVDLKYILNEKNKLITYEFIETLLKNFDIKIKIENLVNT